MKKVLLLLGGLFFAFLVAVISIPFFVDVDKYRPQILEAVNSKVNGKIELGKLSLSLWGAVKINAESINIVVNGFDKPLLQAKEFKFEIPLHSLLTGPEIIAAVNNPKIAIITDANGVMNLQALMKAEKSAANTDREEPIKSVAAAPTGDSPAVPAFLLNSSLGVAISGGDVDVSNRQTGASYQLAGLELEGRNLGFNRTLTIKFLAPIKGSQPGLKFQGDITGHANLYPVLKDQALRGAKGQVSIDATKLAIEYGKNLFQKSSAMPLKLDADLDSTDTEMMIKKLDVNIHDLMLSGKGVVSLHPSLKAKLEVNSSAWNLSKVSDLVPMLKTYGLKGTAQLNLGVGVEGNRNSAQGDLKISDGEIFMRDKFKEPLKIQAQASFSESSLALSRLSLTGPESDLQIQGNVMGFTAPKFNVAANGKSFNLDKLMLPAQKAAAFALIEEAYAALNETQMNPIAKMMAAPIMSQASGTFNAKIGRVVAQGAEVKNVEVETLLSPGAILQVKRGSLQGFGGTAAMTGAFSLKSPGLDYKTNGKANGISAKEAISSYFPKFRNTLEGKANADWNVAGNLYPVETRLESITGTVKINATDGILRTADFKESIQGTLSKVPFLKNTKVPDYEEGFKTLRADMKFQGGNIKVEPVELVSKGKGFNIKGKSNISKNLEQDSYLDVYDPNGILPKELNARPGQPAIPLHITGAINGPKTDYGYTVNRLASTVGKDAAKKALSKGLEKYLGGSEGGQGGDDIKKKLTDQLKKKFKF